MNDMRAALFDSYGPPDVLYVGRVPVPEPRPGQVLVRVHAVSVNGGELHGRAGRLRLVTGRRFPQRTGIDFAGEVAADAAGFRTGAPVWGALSRTFGAAAEFVAVDADRLAPAPAGTDLIEAAALPAVGTTAITALRDKARLRPGERLLVRGAGGGAGSAVVQLGHSMGAHVTALASAKTCEFVRGLGADEAFDYATTRPADLGRRFDVVLDTVGTDLPAWRGLLAPGGRMVGITFDTRHVLTSLASVAASAVHGRGRIRFFSGNPRRELLADLARRTTSGAIRPVVHEVFPLERIADAHRALETGGVRGKIVVAVR
ncbi:NADPH:quinone reductase-like Zn-dependent oxidoreductase [Amycolatopsis endophytica]|uniref:NADPH:quinone reductase-like Zn-dependent oxidoreductase n=2 Tax=Amycolatopsis endophytica TaxID=860233 RepID=A0A853B9L1_9PSEU|nr:NADPH:quinone reductase-like Zn-dependent oxidoreductase [Amycolatopsis endophytica]